MLALVAEGISQIFLLHKAISSSDLFAIIRRQMKRPVSTII